MKTITQLKKLFFLTILFLMVGNVWGQTWTSTPGVGLYTAYGTGTNFSCGVEQRVAVSVQTLNATTFKIFVRRITGDFISGSIEIVKTSNCANSFYNVNINGGSNAYSLDNINHNVAAGNTQTFFVRVIQGNFTLISKSFTINSSQPTGIPDLIINSGMSYNPASIEAGGSINVLSKIDNVGNSAASASRTGIYYSNDNILSTNDQLLNTVNVGSISAGLSSSQSNVTVTIPSNALAGVRFIIAKTDINNDVSESNENNNILAKSIQISITTLPNLRVDSCFDTNSSAFNVGAIMSGSVAVRNTPSSQSWNGNITVFMRHTMTGTNYNLISQNYTIAGGNSQLINFNNITMSFPTGTYKLYCQYTNSPNGGIDFINNNGICSESDNTSTGTITPTKLITITSSPNLVCGTSTVTPTAPIQNQPASFAYTISNAGSANYVGTLTMWWRNTTNVGTAIGTAISSLNAGDSHTFTHNSNLLQSTPGNYLLRIERPDGSVICSRNITVTAPASCITWTGTPPTGDKLTAANYLCNAGIIINTQNGTENATNAITRELMAKLAYLSIYKGLTPNSPAANFPVPFTDMQGSTSQWLTAVKVLSYLQFDDDTTPFDRDFINFKPGDLLQRKYCLKVLLEAFNMPLSTNTSSPYTDIPNTDPQFKYIRTAYEEKLLPGGNIFNVSGNVNMTREDLFVALWKILSTSSIEKPTAAQLNSSANYFVPGNNRMATSGKVPDVDQANFNHYQKTSFSIAGRGVSLDFTHTYNSFLTELPKGYFEEDDSSSSQKFTPLGIGWTHTYNIYAQKVSGYTFESQVEPDKLMVYYPDGSINTFNYATGAADGIGIYDVMTKTNITGGERITITTKGQVKYVFENYNNGKFYFIKAIKDRNNNGVKCTWQASSNTPAVAKYQLKTVQEEFNNNTLGRSLTFGYASIFSPYIQSVTESGLNRLIQFTVDLSSKELRSYRDPKNQQTIYSYDDINNYIKSNLLTEIQLPKGNRIRNTYTNRKLTASRTVSPSNVVTSTNNVNWVPNYSAAGFNSSSTLTDPQGKNTSYTHNTNGNPTNIVSPTGTTSFNSYASGNNANLPTGITVNGQSSNIGYDSRGNVLNVTKNGITNSFTYNLFNDILTQIDGRGFTTTYSYDGLGNLSNVQRPTGGGNTAISRNSFGQPTIITNPSGIQTSFGYNPNGLTNQISLPLGIQTSSVYDNASRLLSTTDANAKITSYQYDLNDNLTRSTNALGSVNGRVDHTYDPNDNHLTIKNPKNETQTNTFNPDDDMLASETFGTHAKSYTYNVDGSIATFTRGNGTFTYTYDATTGRLANDGQTQYTYDIRGNVKTVINTNGTLTMNYDVNDRLINYVDYFGNTVAYLYDANDNVTRITYPGNRQVNYVYDALNRCTSVTDWNSKVTLHSYLTDDRVLKITLPNGTFTDYTYDAAGRPTAIINKKANGTIISSYGFTMDNAGNHLTETINEPSITTGLQTISNQAVTYGSYPFNRIQSQASTNFTHNTAGGITQAGASAYTYDLNDNMLTAPNSTFSYDGAGNRRAKTVSGTNTRYVLSILGMSQVLMETNGSNAVQNFYVYGPIGLLYSVKADNSTYAYYHYDYRGSTTAITNEAQNVTHSYSYDPFGKVLAKVEADANPFQYVGQHGVQYESPTLTFMRARYYDPTIGRFVSEDPIWHLNLYPYADNNPVMGIDPRGQSTIMVSALTSGIISVGLKIVWNNVEGKPLTEDIVPAFVGGFTSGILFGLGLKVISGAAGKLAENITKDIYSFTSGVCWSKDMLVNHLRSKQNEYAKKFLFDVIAGNLVKGLSSTELGRAGILKLAKMTTLLPVDMRTSLGIKIKEMIKEEIDDAGLKYLRDNIKF